MCALMWFLLRVYPCMSCKMTILWESLVTKTEYIAVYLIDLLHVSNHLSLWHWYDFSPECIKFSAKTLSQRLHWYGFSPVCVLMCLLRLELSEKAKSQCVHWYGLSSVCILKCLLRLEFCEKTKSQCVHWYGFSSTCILLCRVSCPSSINACNKNCIDI